MAFLRKKKIKKTIEICLYYWSLWHRVLKNCILFNQSQLYDYLLSTEKSPTPEPEEPEPEPEPEPTPEKLRLGPPQKDMDFLAEMERERLAEERQMKASKMFNKIKRRISFPKIRFDKIVPVQECKFCFGVNFVWSDLMQKTKTNISWHSQWWIPFFLLVTAYI